MRKQITSKILMIEPVAFGFNEQTAVNNHFQMNSLKNSADIQSLALKEFRAMVRILSANSIDVVVIKDTFEPHTPDSIFPNNWVSFHGEGQVVLYPMFAENRRLERRKDILDDLNEQHCDISNIVDFTFWEEQNQFLEGTGSMILDRVNRIAYAALSERTDKTVFLQFCKVFEFKPIYFHANQTVNDKRLPIYHTNVLMSVANEYAVICADCIDDEDEKNTVLAELRQSGKEVIIISEEQMLHFAGNVLQVETKDGKQLLVMSQSAHDTLNDEQLKCLSVYNDLVIVSIPTIETIGGGSVRCMMAEIF